MSDSARPVATITSGAVRGVVSDNGTLAFRGIPYATVRLPENRFRAAAPVEPWTGIRDAAEYGPASPQRVPAVLAGPEERQGEDCLVANVWTPGLDRAGLPVVVWLHGGAYCVGSGAGDNTAGGGTDGPAAALRNGVVVVSLNHRLDVFGHLYLGGILGPDYADTANTGILDLVDGLAWVQREIAAFGGDPGNVTIVGVSGGGNKVVTLLASPLASGLFHRAISISGHELVRPWDLDRADRVAREILAELGITGRPADILTVPTDDVLVAGIRVGLRLYRDLKSGYGDITHYGLHFPVADGRVLPQPRTDSLRAGTNSGVPLLIGTNRHDHFGPGGVDDALPRLMVEREISTFPSAPWATRYGWLTRDELADVVRPHLRDRTDWIVDAYRSAYPTSSPSALLGEISTDVDWRIPAIRIAEARLEAGAAPTYAYVAREGPHALFFGGTSLYPVDRALAQQINESWMTFVRDGVPRSALLPEWKPYSASVRSTMLFDDQCELVDDPRGAARAVWDGIR